MALVEGKTDTECATDFTGHVRVLRYPFEEENVTCRTAWFQPTLSLIVRQLESRLSDRNLVAGTVTP